MFKHLIHRLVSVGLALTLFQTLYLKISSAAPTLRVEREYGCRLNASASSVLQFDVLPANAIKPKLFFKIKADVLALRKIFDVSAALVFIKETRGPNAYADDYVPSSLLARFNIPPDTTQDGVVYLGVDLLANEYNSFFKTGYGIPSLIAHEFAHILQFKYSFPLTDKWQELDADYLAGWFTAYRAGKVPQNVEESMMSFYNKGDYAFNDKDHHGTPEERLTAFKTGLDLYRRHNIRSSSRAYEQGLRYIRRQQSTSRYGS